MSGPKLPQCSPSGKRQHADDGVAWTTNKPTLVLTYLRPPILTALLTTAAVALISSVQGLAASQESFWASFIGLFLCPLGSWPRPSAFHPTCHKAHCPTSRYVFLESAPFSQSRR